MILKAIQMKKYCFLMNMPMGKLMTVIVMKVIIVVRERKKYNLETLFGEYSVDIGVLVKFAILLMHQATLSIRFKAYQIDLLFTGNEGEIYSL